METYDQTKSGHDSGSVFDCGHANFIHFDPNLDRYLSSFFIKSFHPKLLIKVGLLAPVNGSELIETSKEDGYLNLKGTTGVAPTYEENHDCFMTQDVRGHFELCLNQVSFEKVDGFRSLYPLVRDDDLMTSEVLESKGIYPGQTAFVRR